MFLPFMTPLQVKQVKTSDFDYYLPAELIAQTPLEPRDHSNLMVLNHEKGCIQQRKFYNLPEYLHEGDVLVFNDTRVINARLTARKNGSTSPVEVFLLKRLEPGIWETLVKPGRKARPGHQLRIVDAHSVDNGKGVDAEVLDVTEGGMRIIRFGDEALLPELGAVPLPPYIHTHLDNPERYQTVYSRNEGSVAAPTAGLHFTPELLSRLENKGIQCAFVTLHVGIDTFRPVHTENPQEHPIHTEYGTVSKETAEQINAARRNGHRVVCVGTTSVRLVEAAAAVSTEQAIDPFAGWVDLFILPGFQFRITDVMITNFHLPRSTLMMLVSAFAGRDLIMRGYREAVENNWRFFSFGDAMLLL